MDQQGIALAAIQGPYAAVQERDAQDASLAARVGTLEQERRQAPTLALPELLVTWALGPTGGLVSRGLFGRLAVGLRRQ